ncbi:MAG: hypothetical protein KIT45_14320 [Fimbriimonadia bacterium]|nr:hypothetical protein [Fimbriimonadia bacterium]
MTQKTRNGAIAFAHPREADFAQMLDSHQIRWEYEPNTFILQTDEDGYPKECYTPDFYLTEYDLYVELSAKQGAQLKRQQQRLAQLKEAHPGIQVLLVDGQECERMLARNGARWFTRQDERLLDD